MEFIKHYLDYGVIGILGVMSLFVVGFSIERYLYYRSVRVSQFVSFEDLQVNLTQHLTLISSVAANAPYIGLLGTVFGIMVTFDDIGNSGNIDTQSIMVGLALALKATAMGLFVAIPAMIFYNALLRRVEVLLAEWKSCFDEVSPSETL
ncbi:TonB-system energizer ExbB [uncultured Oceanicoccus sp.]|uniref:TonB-system energizer ExbB n=1 Tax=uncultured Oceanicoccus sp. TaxID=1706381 RepID=UPI0030DBEA1D